MRAVCGASSACVLCVEPVQHACCVWMYRVEGAKPWVKEWFLHQHAHICTCRGQNSV